MFMSVFRSSNTYIHLFLGDGVMNARALHAAIESDLLQRRREDELGIINENSADFIGVQHFATHSQGKLGSTYP